MTDAHFVYINIAILIKYRFIHIMIGYIGWAHGIHWTDVNPTQWSCNPCIRLYSVFRGVCWTSQNFMISFLILIKDWHWRIFAAGLYIGIRDTFLSFLWLFWQHVCLLSKRILLMQYLRNSAFSFDRLFLCLILKLLLVGLRSSHFHDLILLIDEWI